MDDHVHTHVTTIHSVNLTEQQSVKKEEKSDFIFLIPLWQSECDSEMQSRSPKPVWNMTINFFLRYKVQCRLSPRTVWEISLTESLTQCSKFLQSGNKIIPIITLEWFCTWLYPWHSFLVALLLNTRTRSPKLYSLTNVTVQLLKVYSHYTFLWRFCDGQTRD